jgi:hypothetical protein
MDRRSLLRALPRLVLAWLALTGGVALVGAHALVAVRAPLQFMVELLLPGFVTSISVDPHTSGGVVIDVFAIRPVAISGDHVVTPWVRIQEGVHAGHDFVPAIILLAVLLAWPYRNWRQAVAALAWGVPMAVALVGWVVSVHFAGLLELSLQRVAGHYHEARETPFFLTQMIFLESGGQWLLGLLGAAAIGSFVTRGSRGLAPSGQSKGLQGAGI